MALIYDYQSFKDYFSNVATSNVDIADFKYGDNEKIINEIRSSTVLPCLYLLPYIPIKMDERFSDRQAGLIQSTFMLLDTKPKKYDDQQTRYKELEAICLQIIAKIDIDNQNGDVNMDRSGFQWGEYEHIFGATIMWGCRMDVRFFIPLRIIYDQSKWQ